MACDPSLMRPIDSSTRAIVVGGGRSGCAAAKLLRALGASVRMLEKTPENLPQEFQIWAVRAGVSIVGGEHLPEHFLGANLVVPSPGAALSSIEPLLPQPGAPEVLAETELAWRQLEGEPVIGITGTSGKTTTTSLCSAMLVAHGLDVFTGGNIGTPLSEYVLARKAGTRRKADAVVLELSSFQLQTCTTLRPRVGMLLNVSENHLDYHKDMREYIEAKMRLFRCQEAGDKAVFGPELKSLPEHFNLAARVVYFDTNACRFPYTPLFGVHNHANAEAAWQAAREFGVSEEEAATAVREFRPLPHRLERVAEIDGVLYVNDSKCTTLEALKVALQAFDRPILLMAGGKFKGGNPSGLNDIVRTQVRAIGLYGASREIFEDAWKDIVPTSWDQTLRSALARLQGIACPGDVILLAPATASYDQYKNYEMRGKDFCQAVLEACHG